MNKPVIALLSALICIPNLHLVMVEAYEGEIGGYKNYFNKMPDFDGLLFSAFVLFSVILVCCFLILKDLNKKKNYLTNSLIGLSFILLVNFLFSFGISLTTESINSLGLSIVIGVLTGLLAFLLYNKKGSERE